MALIEYYCTRLVSALECNVMNLQVAKSAVNFKED